MFGYVNILNDQLTSGDKPVRSLDKVLSSERRRLKRLMAAGQKKLGNMARELATLKRHLEALSMFESTWKGKTARTSRRRRRGPSRRASVLTTIKNSSNGMSRGQILEKLKVKGDKAAEQSVSNALSYLKKAGTIKSRDGAYTGA
jgi:hypothetical protein